MLVNGAGNQFLARTGFTGNQDARVSPGDFGYTGEHPLQSGRSSDDLLEHRCLIDFFPQRNVLDLESLLSQLAILDISRGNIPTNDASLFISERIPTGEEPAIFRIIPKKTYFSFVRDSI